MKLADRVYETSSTTGTGTITLDGAATGYQSFASAFTDSDQVPYCIEDGTDWEVGLGTYSASTLSRDTVYASSNADAAVNWGVGNRNVFVVAAADVAATRAGVETLQNKTLESPAINGGYSEEHFALTGTSVALDPANGSIQTHTLTGATTYTDSLADGESIALMIDDGSANTVTWPTMTWVNGAGAAPTLAVTGYTVVTIWKVSGVLYGALVGDGS